MHHTNFAIKYFRLPLRLIPHEAREIYLNTGVVIIVLMHAYLLIGSDKSLLKKKAEGLAKKGKGKVLEFTIKKIDDVRKLSSYIKLKLNEPTFLLIEDIHEATNEALNAFLKNLEEPQEEVTYILTANSEYKVLSTITSRCQIIKVDSSNASVDKTALEFLNMKKADKLKAISKLKKRDEAKKFIENLIVALHESLHSEEKNKLKIAKDIKNAQRTLTALGMNANVNLQLAKFVTKT